MTIGTLTQKQTHAVNVIRTAETKTVLQTASASTAVKTDSMACCALNNAVPLMKCAKSVSPNQMANLKDVFYAKEDITQT